MTLGGAALGELEVEAEGLALAVNEVAKLAACTESLVAVTECFLAAFPHVLMGPTKADCADSMLLVGGVGAKGVGG
jgi:hypothetical protein